MLAFKKAVYAVLSSDSTLLALTTIHDMAKLNEDLPYIDIANVSERDFSSKIYTGSEYFPIIHVWATTSDIVLQIAERIRHLLHRQEFAVVGWYFVVRTHI